MIPITMIGPLCGSILRARRGWVGSRLWAEVGKVQWDVDVTRHILYHLGEFHHVGFQCDFSVIMGYDSET